MNLNDGSWKQYLARVTVLCAGVTLAVFAGNRLANAGPGEPVRKSLTVAGTLTGVSGSTATAAFRFYRAMGDATPLCAPEVTIRDGVERNAATGTFSVEVPLTQSGHECPDTLFHDPSVFVEVAIADSLVAPRAPVNPVPYAIYAQQYGTPDCPAGYERDSAEPTFIGDMRLCKRYQITGAARTVVDEVVRVGVGPAAFWIDRFEATVWPNHVGPDPTLPYGCSVSYPTEFRTNGQWRTDVVRTPPARAASRRGFDPSTCLTWFQANEACRASGKRLPDGDEWLSAAQGTPDPGVGDICRIGVGVGGLRSASVSTCVSAWGAADMVGNAWEWTAEWFAGVGDNTFGSAPWPTGYNGDGTWNITSTASSGMRGMPASARRGGGWENGVQAGIFALSLSEGPSAQEPSLGFRCVIPR